ncbi:type II secretion system F family protein [Candidatus Sumerlaeota bacterium]|nr:type II secretion system F family protein [Candidatus Sumerlaeota bacterium]
MMQLPTTNAWLVTYLIMASLSVGLCGFTLTSAMAAGSEAYSKRFAGASEATLGEMFIYMPATFIMTLKLACMGFGAAVGFLVGIGLPNMQAQFIPIIFLSVPCFFIPDIIIKRAYASRIYKFRLQMIDGLQILSNSVKANLSFIDAIKLMVNESQDPLAGEFRLVVQEVSLGLSLERALENLTKRIPVQDLHLFVASINTIFSMGEGIIEVCEKTVLMVQERFRVERRIETLTAEGKTQSLILTSAPFALMLILFFIDPNLPAQLFTTTAGFVILVMVIVLDAIGYYVINKIVDIKL